MRRAEGIGQGRAQVCRDRPSRRATCAPRRHGRHQEAREGSQDQQGRSRSLLDRDSEGNRCRHCRDRSHAGVKRKGNPHGLRSYCMSEAEFQQSSPTAFDVPRHVAIIMDGHGRWAAGRGLPRAEGHRRGVEALRRTIRAAGEMGIRIVTIFSFSAENWSRPASEVGELMGLLRRFVRNDLAELHKSNVRVRVIGERTGLEPDIGRLLVEAEELTKNNDGLILVVAFNYGARQEIVRAAQRVAQAVKQGELGLSDIDMDLLGRFLDAPDIPDPDLIIRTSGEQRLSNFLLWQAAYSELVFVPTYWPDFDRATLETAIREYQQRERRFGGLVAQTGS